MRTFLSLLLVASTAFASAQFKVDPQKIPVVQAKRRALIIGASDYQSLGKLTYASSDAERFRDALMTGYKFTDDSIHFISDAPTSLEKPTASTILHALNQMLADPVLDKGDLFILFFSGHGMATGGRDFLCATDTKVSDVQTTGLPVNEVIQKLVDAKLRNVVIIADACRAGDKNDFGSELYDQAKKANIAILLGCEPGKKSYEVPQLRSGAFTYFLLKALSNPKNRTESGGLWMSKVAENTEANVFEYTAHDYGDNAQRPKSFADPTSDVMLAKFINRPDPTKPEGKNVDLEMVNDPRKNSDQMLETSLQYILKDDYTRSLEASKQALSLNSQNYLAAYYAALASSRLGRSGEQEKYCDSLKKLDDPYYRSLGYVSSDSRATPIPDRIKALETFWESSPKDIVHALIVWGKARTYLPMMITKVLIQKMLPDIKAGSRVAAFFEGEIAVADGQLETALAKYRTAITRADFSEFLSDEELTVIQFPLLRQLHRNEELKTILRAQFSHDKVSAVMWVTAAANLKEMGNRDAAISIIKKGIKEPGLSELEIVIAGTTIGASIGEIADDLEAQSKSLPFSWKVRTVALIAKGVKKREATATEKAFEEAARYCDDELEIISLTAAITDSIIEDATKNLGIPAEKFAESREGFRLMFFNRADHLGTDSEKWYQLGQLGVSTLQGPATLRLFKLYLKDFNANSELGSEFYTMLFQLATSVEDDALAKFAINHPALAEPDRSDTRLLYCSYLVSRGDYAQLKTLFATIGQVSPSTEIVKKSLAAIVRARSGEVAGLKAFLKQNFSNTEGDLVAQGIAALALSDLGLNQEAMSHLEHLSQYQPSTVVSISLRCMTRYFKLLKAAGKVKESDLALFDALKINQSSPGIMASHFGLKPDIMDFVGSISADTNWISDQTYDPKIPSHKGEYQSAATGSGKFVLNVSKEGLAKGTIEILDGEKFELAGTVDSYGNLRAKAHNKTHTFDVEAKLISNEFKKTETFVKSSIGQMINVYNERGLVTHWMLSYGTIKH